MYPIPITTLITMGGQNQLNNDIIYIIIIISNHIKSPSHTHFIDEGYAVQIILGLRN